jgi:phosphohistidine phosphatase
MRLYLMRHGLAVDPADPKCPPDPERPLTPKGIEKTRAAALGLRALGLKPDVMFSSPLLRALQTAEVAAEVLGYLREKIRRSDALKPGGKPSAFFHEISRVRGAKVFAFGHAPQLDELVAHAIGAPHPVTALKKAGVACLEMESFTPVRGGLLWVLTPKVLRLLGEM